MAEWKSGSDQPIRVVVFGSGPALERGVRQFIHRLEECPEIDLLGGFFQSSGQGLRPIVDDLWRRRGLLAVPLLVGRLAGQIWRSLGDGRAEGELNRKLALMTDRIHFVRDIHAEHVLERIRALAPDLGLSYGSPILKPKVFGIPRWGCLGIHHGKLPEYRGNKTPFWAMYNGEETAGVTIQKINAALDLGEIVQEGAVHINRRSRRAVWNELEALGLDLYLQAIREVRQGTATYRHPVGQKGKLYRNPSLGDLLRFSWRQAMRRLNRSHSLPSVDDRSECDQLAGSRGQ